MTVRTVMPVGLITVLPRVKFTLSTVDSKLRKKVTVKVILKSVKK